MTRREFGCEQCGYILTAISPDDIHTVFLIDKSEDTDCIKTIYSCDDCNNDIIRYWCKNNINHVGGTLFRKTKSPY